MEQSRRVLFTKGFAGVTALGIAWSAPKIQGLSLRPDFAAAQSVAPTTTVGDSPGAFFDFDLALDGFLSTRSTTDGLPSGIDRVHGELNLITPSQEGYLVGISGSAAGIDCFVTGADGGPGDIGAWFDTDLGTIPGGVPGVSHGGQLNAALNVGFPFGGPPWNTTIHVSCA